MAAPETKKKRTTLIRVEQEHIDWILTKREVLPPFLPFPSLSDAAIEDVFRDKPELRERLHREVAEIAAVTKKLQDEDDDILQQYNAKGYAVQEIEIGDNDDDDYGEEAAGRHRSRL